jgi:signal transduction histidine kinase
MHGAVRVETTEGGGATFVVELPLAPALQRV